MHAFPSDPIQNKKWQKVCKIDKVTKSTRICRNHFDENDYEPAAEFMTRKRLKAGVIPSKFLPEDMNITVDISCDLDLGQSCIDKTWYLINDFFQIYETFNIYLKIWKNPHFSLQTYLDKYVAWTYQFSKVYQVGSVVKNYFNLK